MDYDIIGLDNKPIQVGDIVRYVSVCTGQRFVRTGVVTSIDFTRKLIKVYRPKEVWSWNKVDRKYRRSTSYGAWWVSCQTSVAIPGGKWVDVEKAFLKCYT